MIPSTLYAIGLYAYFLPRHAFNPIRGISRTRDRSRLEAHIDEVGPIIPIIRGCPRFCRNILFPVHMSSIWMQILCIWDNLGHGGPSEENGQLGQAYVEKHLSKC